MNGYADQAPCTFAAAPGDSANGFNDLALGGLDQSDAFSDRAQVGKVVQANATDIALG
ncbi:MAG: hypothetical protein K2Q11_02575 [Burkholderiaceae bacterium]|nr:hypothetical protein [Burkholderiaceae bacterium]